MFPILFFLLLFAPAQDLARNDLHARAEQARARGDLAAARRIYEQVLAATPRDGRAAVGLGETMLELEDFGAAEELLTRVVRSLPGRPEPRRVLALVYLRLGREKEALAEAEKAVELDPKSAEGYVSYGAALNAVGRSAEAIGAFQKALAIRPRSLPALHGLARVYAVLEDPRAEATFEQVLAIAPKNLPVRFDLIEYLWQARRFEEGNAAMERLLREIPPNPKLHGRYARALMEQNRFVLAAREFERACRGKACDSELLELWASALFENGRFEEAASRYRDAIAASPDRISARHTLGRLLLLKGDAPGAGEELKRAAELRPDSAPVLLDLGRALEASGRLVEAESAYRKALELEPALSRTHYALGTLLARTQRRDEAREHIALYQDYFQKEQQRRLRQSSRRAELNLGWTHLKRNRLEESLAQFRRHPDDVEALRGVAAALSRLGRHAEAAKALEHALVLSPDDNRVQHELDREYTRLRAK